MKVKNVMLILSAIVFALPCIAQTGNQKKEEKKLMDLSREWAKTVKTRDVVKTVSYWSPDAVLMTPDQGKIMGHEQLSAMVKGGFEIPGFEIDWEPQKAHVAESGDLGYVLAHKSVRVPDASGNLNTYYFIEVGIWEKQKDGSWKNTIDIYNPDPSIDSIDN